VSSESGDPRTEGEFEERARRCEFLVGIASSARWSPPGRREGGGKGKRGHSRAMRGAIIIALESSAHRSFFPKVRYPPVRPSISPTEITSNYIGQSRWSPMMPRAFLGASFPTRAKSWRIAISRLRSAPEPRRPFLACT